MGVPTTAGEVVPLVATDLFLRPSDRPVELLYLGTLGPLAALDGGSEVFILGSGVFSPKGQLVLHP